MSINVTFIEDHNSADSGWSLYRVGEKATFPDSRAAALIAGGVAHKGWSKPEQQAFAELVTSGETTIAGAEFAPDYDAMTLNDLRHLCKERGVKPGGRRKADHVAALEDADNG